MVHWQWQGPGANKAQNTVNPCQVSKHTAQGSATTQDLREKPWLQHIWSLCMLSRVDAVFGSAALELIRYLAPAVHP